MEIIKFKDLKLSEDVLNSIEKLKYEVPSEIQGKIIPHILNGDDVVGQAQTGTGKTLAFAASIMSLIEPKNKSPKVLVLAPTRELALQIEKEFKMLNSNKFRLLTVYGGSKYETQISELRRGIDILVGTPGRLIDLIKKRYVKISDLDFLVLDEADEMLNMGFIPDIEYIFEQTNKEKQTLLFSATMKKPILKLAEKYMKKDYTHVSVVPKMKTSETIEQVYYHAKESDKVEILSRILDITDVSRAIVFCRTKRSSDTLLSELSERGYKVGVMHGDVPQNMRIETLDRFKKAQFNVLVATDVAARGIHVDDVDMVVNYHLPQENEAYIHRIGRTGRAGNLGLAVSLVNQKEERTIREIAAYAKCDITKKEIPSLKEIMEIKYSKVIEEMSKPKGNEEKVFSKLSDLTDEQLSTLLANLLEEKVKQNIGSNKDIKPAVNRRKQGLVRIFLTIGKMDNLKKGTLLDFIKQELGIPKDVVNNIEIVKKFTFLDIDEAFADEFIKKIYNKKLNNRIIRAEIAKRQS